MRIVTRTLIFVWCLFAGVAFADDITPNAAVRNGVIIRAEASTDSDRLGRLMPGETLTFVADQSGWWEVRLANGRTGFVSKRWTARVAAPEPVQPTDDGPGLSASAEMLTHFVNVGQGGGAILEFPCGVAVIDTGGQFGSQVTRGHFMFRDYLTRFMAAHPQFSNRIDVVFTTHAHADHLNGLPTMFNAEGELRYEIRNVVDNAISAASGSAAKQTDFRDAVLASGGGYSGISINSSFEDAGVTNAVIDPIECEGVNPEFTLYWGSWESADIQALGGRGTAHNNPNNHSLVIRVDFGAASFLFTGDLEQTAIEDMLLLHQGNLAAFDVDVYVVGHHGSPNATTLPFLEAMTPEIAIVSAGDPAEEGTSTARDHGHPRISALDMMQQGPGAVSRMRASAVTAPAFAAEDRDAVDYVVDHAIYSTGWEGDLVLRATTSGEFELMSSN